jgi:hypothetical protein
MRRLLILSLLALTACDDAAPTGQPALDQGALDQGIVDAAPDPDAQAPMPDAALPDLGPAPEPAFIELTLSPRRSLYTRADQPTATAVVYDRVGTVIDDVALRFDIQPAILGRIDDGVISFASEGQGAVRACVPGSDLCGRATFYVDDGPPPLEIGSPTRGLLLSGEPSVRVEGRTDPDALVFINDQPAEVDADGWFVQEMPLVFGLNRIDAIADDGVRRPPTRVVMEVVYAPDVLPVDDTGVALNDVIRVRLDQALLDAATPVPQPDEAGVTRMGDLAGLTEAFLSHLALMNLVPNPVLAEGNPMSLRILDIDPGTTDATLAWTATGMEIFLRIEDLTLHTEGLLTIEGVPISLTGAIQVTASAFATVIIEADANGQPSLRLDQVDVAIESLGGIMDDTTAQAVLDTFGSLLRSVLETFARDLISDVTGGEVPDFLALSLGDAIAPLSHIPLDLEASPPIPEIRLDLGFELSEPSTTPRGALELGLSGHAHLRVPTAPPYPFAGVPAEGLGEAPPWPAVSTLGLAVRMTAVNALLYTVWQQGALNLDLTAIIPDNLQALIPEARLDARLPPLVVGTAPGSPYLFELQFGELDLYLRGLRSGPTPDRYVLSLRAGLHLEVGDGGIRFTIAENADIRVALLDYSGQMPAFEPEILEQLLEPLIWPRVREQVGDGLNLTIPSIEIGRDAFGDIAPTIDAIGVQLDWPAEPLVRRGWFVLPASLALELR